MSSHFISTDLGNTCISNVHGSGWVMVVNAEIEHGTWRIL